MRLYDLSCPQCGWKSDLPVVESVAKQFAALKYCAHCKEHGKPPSQYVMREHITVGPYTKYRPGRKDGSH